MGGETIAKILFRPKLAEPERHPSLGIRIHWEYLPAAEREIARRLEPSLNRGLSISLPYCQRLAHSYRIGVRFLDST